MFTTYNGCVCETACLPNGNSVFRIRSFFCAMKKGIAAAFVLVLFLNAGNNS